MKLAFSSNAFGRYSLLDTIGILADIGYEGIEIMADVPHAYPPDLTRSDLESIREALSRHAMEISNINAFMLRAIGNVHHPSWIEKDPVLRRKRIEHTSNCIDLADRLGARMLSTEPGGPLDGMEPALGLELFREGLREIEDHAREKNVRILIEPEPGLLIETSSQFRTFFRDLNPEVFGLNFDIGHFFCVGEDPAALIYQLAPFICHFHLEDISRTRVHHHLLPGRGALDFRSITNAIRGINYTGFVTVELYPYEDHPIDAAREAFAYLQEFI
jgi:sugar phosphate isomerase/epimerase